MNFRWLGTLLDSFLQEQTVIDLKLTTNDEVMAGKQFSSSKHNRKIFGKVISISQIKVFQFLKEAEAQLRN